MPRDDAIIGVSDHGGWAVLGQSTGTTPRKAFDAASQACTSTTSTPTS